MSFLDKMKKTGQETKIRGELTLKKTKLRGEVKLAERDMTTQKKNFGLELFDILTDDKQKLLGVMAGTLFKGQQTEMKDAFEKARDDIAGIQAKKDVKQKEFDVLEGNGAGALPDGTINEKMTKFGKVLSKAGNEKKLQAQMALLDREIKIRKEKFGLEVFDVTTGSDGTDADGLSQHEKDIVAIIDNAKYQMEKIKSDIASKEDQIKSLDEEMKNISLWFHPVFAHLNDTSFPFALSMLGLELPWKEKLCWLMYVFLPYFT